MKKIIAMALVVMMALAILASCGAPSEMKEAAGTWTGVHTKFVGDSEWVEEEEFSLVLTDDGKAVSKRGGEEYNATWSLEGENFKMTETFLGIKIEYTGTLKDGELDIFNGDPTDDLTCEYVYKK